MADRASLDFPDPLQNTPELDLDHADELISQLAGDEIDRLISSSDDLEPVGENEIVLTPAPKPTVEELTAQLDEVFEEIRNRAPSPPPVRIDLSAPDPITLPEPVLAMRRFDEPEALDVRDARELKHRRSLLDPMEDTRPAVIRWLAWLNAPVLQLARGPRVLVSVVSLLSFAGSVAALIYVLMLRRSL